MRSKIIILIMITIIISSCTSQKEECIPINNTIYINNTITEYKEVIVREYINTTAECEEEYSQDYVNRILRDYERCRYQLAFLNNTELGDDFYDLNISLSRCEKRIEDMREALD
ncbi:unnamed protein product [marine sediment metagenome]|uniref:Uncharacterized protein n=1 Tax=marine sediment metagenome TaxID=412755 RepID=X0W5H9_9ZZZZ